MLEPCASVARAASVRSPHLGLTIATALVAAAIFAAPAAAITFTQPVGSPVTVGSFNPRSVAVGDLNGDGKPDLATANEGSSNVTVLLGDGAGAFTQPAGSPVTVGSTPVSVAVGDFNGDGKPDLATANVNSNNVTVLLGDGAGGFTQPAGSPVTVGNPPRSVAVGDLNGDGRPDLATANGSSHNVTVLLGDGAGAFTQPAGSPVTVGSTPYSVAVGDLNGDGKPDLATANLASNNVTVLLGDGAGGFTQPAGSPVTVGSSPHEVAVGDLSGDGKPDLAIANIDSNNVTVLLGNGAGAFTQPAGSPVTVGSGPFSVAVGDFDGDGRPDLATANFNSNNVTVLLGNGAGAFTQPAGSPVTVGSNPTEVRVGDLNGDGRPDLATANVNSHNVTVLRNDEAFGGPPAGSVLVSELRLSGPNGADDQFVELYNTSAIVSRDVGGWSLQGSNGRSVPVPYGTLIPPLGHVLLTGPPSLPAGYSLNAYGPLSLQLPSGNGGALRFPQTGGGVKLLSPFGAVIDAAGFTGAAASFFEGAPVTSPSTFSGQQFAFARRISAGVPVDTDNNAADFVQVNAGSNAGNATFGSPVLGAPSPNGLASPTQHNDILQSSLLDSGVGASSSPNLVYTAGSPATLVVNRKLTNCSGQPATGVCVNSPTRAATAVTRLRFRISDLTTIGSLGAGPGQAILLGQSSPGSVGVPISAGGGGGTANVVALPLDAPSAAGLGGLGSTFTATASLPGGGLTPGASINVQFKFNVSQGGSYRFAYDAEDDLVPFTGKPPKPPKPPKTAKAKVAAAAEEAIAPLTTGTVTKSKATAAIRKLTKRP